MDPIFTLPWTEFSMAKVLSKHFKKKDGYTLLVPLSREEKGIDLVLLKKANNGESKAVTLQVKASRTYESERPKRETTQRFKYHTWFNKFEVSDWADYYLLVGHFVDTPDFGKSKSGHETWYRDCTLLFNNREMRSFISSLKTVKGKPEGKFGFGFDSVKKVCQTRGDETRSLKDFTGHLLDNRFKDIEREFRQSK
jgi:hypothetical protein